MSFTGSTYANTEQRKKPRPLEPIREIKAGVLDVGYYDIGASDGPAVPS
jgi:hypothetical protein